MSEEKVFRNKGARLKAAPGSGRKKGDTAIQDVALKTIQAQAILEARVNNVPVPELCKKFGLSEKTIYRRIEWAKQHGLMGELKQRVIEKLGSKSLDVYEQAMSADPSKLLPNEIEAHKMRLSAAKDVAFGSGILNKKPESVKTEEEHSMEWFLSQREKHGQSAGEAEESSGQHSVLNGQLVDPEMVEESGESGNDQNLLPERGDGGGVSREDIADDLGITDGDGE